MAYERLEPFGDWRADWRAALLASLLYNANRGRGDRALQIDDFMPVFDETTRKRKKDSEMMSKLLSVTPKRVDG